MRLTVKNLACVRGARTVVKGVTFALGEGEGLLLEGPNGAGKTTLLRTLAGFIEQGEGEAAFEGGDPERSVGEQCHYVGHLNGVKAGFTVEENLRFYWSFLEGTDEADIDRAAGIFNLDALRGIPAGLLSAGQKRRLGLARLVLAWRPLWLLDEPSVSLDVASQQALAQTVRDYLTQGGMAIAATHTPLGLGVPQTLEIKGGRAAIRSAA
jgi:heme exporter protein A